MRRYLTTHVLLSALLALTALSAGAQTAITPEDAAAAQTESVPAPAAPADSAPAGPRIRTNVADSGTNGDVIMSSPAPYSTFGILLQSKPSWPSIAAKTGSSDGNSSFSFFNAADTELMRVRSDGFVGIGTASPLYPFHLASNTSGVRGAAFSQHTTDASGSMLYLLKSRGTVSAPTSVAAGDNIGSVAAVVHNGTSYVHTSRMRFLTENVSGAAVPTSIQFLTGDGTVAGGTERMRITSGGMVGIGTNAPQHALDVLGDIRARRALTGEVGALWLTGTDNAGAPHQWAQVAGSYDGKYGVLANAYEIYEYPRTGSPSCCIPRLRIVPATSTNTMLTIGPTGNLGIRAYPNAAALEIVASNATTSISSVASSYQGIVMSNAVDTTVALRMLGGGLAQLTTDGAGRALSFATGHFAEAMRLDPNGNVGIGTPAPTAKLHVIGNIVATGSITGASVIGAVYQDFAEWVPSTVDMAPGTVVILNPAKNNEVMPSATAYDVRVAGVVSAQPGVILGEASDTKEMIATTGRVKVKVDATRSPIAIGDLLVTSDRAGYAMKSIPVEIAGIAMHRPGTIVGKALEPLSGGEGEILVLLSLQ